MFTLFVADGRSADLGISSVVGGSAQGSRCSCTLANLYNSENKNKIQHFVNFDYNAMDNGPFQCY